MVYELTAIGIFLTIAGSHRGATGGMMATVGTLFVRRSRAFIGVVIIIVVNILWA